MGLNKKGIFFTVTVIVILTLFVLTYTFYSNFSDRKPIQKRITTLNNFVFSIEEDMSRQLFISGFRIIFVMEKEIIETGSYISNLNASVNELFFSGSINGVPQQITIGTTFSEIQDSIRQKSNKVNLNITLENPVITLTQPDPWNIEYSLTVDLFAKDNNNLASWNSSKTFKTIIPIENFEDPIYLINTNGKISNTFKKTPYTTLVLNENITNLLDHLTKSYYLASIEAPSFLDRLQGILGPNEKGVESLVNLQELSSQGIIIQDKNIVDHVYFSTANTQMCNINGMPSWFRLDSRHVKIYNASKIMYNCV
jgi:hypothetical protein